MLPTVDSSMQQTRLSLAWYADGFRSEAAREGLFVASDTDLERLGRAGTADRRRARLGRPAGAALVRRPDGGADTRRWKALAARCAMRATLGVPASRRPRLVPLVRPPS